MNALSSIGLLVGHLSFDGDAQTLSGAHIDLLARVAAADRTSVEADDVAARR